MNHKLLDTKTFKHATTKFKELVNSPKAKPRYNEYGTKFRGDTHYIHFAFYALLKGKPLSSIAHDTNSERYKELKAALKKVETGISYFEGLDITKLLSQDFDLSPNNIKLVLCQLHF
jgi:hypothetical protein